VKRLSAEKIRATTEAFHAALREGEDATRVFRRAVGYDLDVAELDENEIRQLAALLIASGVFTAAPALFGAGRNGRIQSLGEALASFDAAQQLRPGAELAEMAAWNGAAVAIAMLFEPEIDLQAVAIASAVGVRDGRIELRHPTSIQIEALTATPFRLREHTWRELDDVVPPVLERLETFLAGRDQRDAHRDLARCWHLRLMLLRLEDGFGMRPSQRLELARRAQEEVDATPLEQRAEVREVLAALITKLEGLPFWSRIRKKTRPSVDQLLAAFRARASATDGPDGAAGFASLQFVAGPHTLPPSWLVWPLS
jgi:hypothetical protein